METGLRVPKSARKGMVRDPVTVDGSTGSLVPTPRVNLKSVDSVRLEMSRVYRQMKSGDLPMEHGSKLVFVLSAIAKTLVESDLEKRLERLEEGGTWDR